MRKLIAASITAALFTSFCTQAVTAQNINVQVSKTYNLKDFTKKTNSYLLKGELTEVQVTDGKITTHNQMVGQLAYTANLNRARYSMKLEKRDKDENVIKENKLEGGESVFGPIAAQIINVKGRVFLIYTKHTGDNSKESESSYEMLTSEIDQQTLEMKDAKKLFALEKLNIGFGGLYDFAENIKYEIKSSPDSSKWLVYFASGVNENMHMTALDKNFNEIWTRNEKIADFKTIIAGDVNIDNYGNVIVSYKGLIKSNKFDKHLAIFNSNAKKDYLISVADAEVVDVTTLASNFEPYTYVIATIGGVLRNVSSLQIYKLNSEDLKLSKYQTIAFNEQILNKFKDLNGATTKGKYYGFSGLRIKPVEMEDKTLALLCENYVYGYDKTLKYEICGSFLVIRFKNDSPLYSVIPRGGSGSSRAALMNYTTILYKNKLVLFYNDLPRNITENTLKNIRTSRIYQDHILAMASVDSDGNVERKIIFDDTKEKSLPLGNMTMVAPFKFSTESYKITGFGNIANEYKIITVSIE